MLPSVSKTCIHINFSLKWRHHTTIFADFRQWPKSINATEGSTVRFHCQAAVNVDDVRWNVNSRSIRFLNSPSVVHRSRPDPNWAYNLHTLEMPALLAYNNSTVQCVFLNLRRPELDVYSEKATLAVQGKSGTKICLKVKLIIDVMQANSPWFKTSM